MVLQRRGPVISELSGAKALYALYMAGASFRLMPNSPIDAVVFDLNELSDEDAVILDNLKSDHIYVAKSPSAVLGIERHRRKIFFDLEGEYTYADYPAVYAHAFMRFAAETGIGGIPYERRIGSPRQITFGKPYPDMEETVLKMDIECLDVLRAPMPLTRHDARELFGIDAKVMLPAAEYFYNGPVPEGELHTFIWRKIIPAAFAWLRFFETTAEVRWGLSNSGFEFKDCLRVIERELSRLKMGGKEIAGVVQGNLYGAYLKSEDPELVPYMTKMRKKGTQWDRTPPLRRKEIYARQSEKAKEKRRLARLLGKRGSTPGPKPAYTMETLADLEVLRKEGKISKPYYFRKRRELTAIHIRQDGVSPA